MALPLRTSGWLALAATLSAPAGAQALQSRTLLVQELKRLEEVLEKTPETSPDFPIVLRSLADGYAELDAIAERERAKSQAAADDAERAARQIPEPRRKLIRGTGTVL